MKHEDIYTYFWFNANFLKIYKKSKGKMELIIRKEGSSRYYHYRGPGWKTQEWLLNEKTGR